MLLGINSQADSLKPAEAGWKTHGNPLQRVWVMTSLRIDPQALADGAGGHRFIPPGNQCFLGINSQADSLKPASAGWKTHSNPLQRVWVAISLRIDPQALADGMGGHNWVL